MKIKHIIFDLDGTLCNTRTMHFDVLNEAIAQIAGKQYAISNSEHNSIYDGLPTKVKLEQLVYHKGLDKGLLDTINALKQELTHQYIQNHFNPGSDIRVIFQKLWKDGYIITIATNMVQKSAYSIIEKLGIMSYVTHIATNESVNHPKPHQEIYQFLMCLTLTHPEETLVFEDSPHGIIGATKSKAYVYPVISMEDISYETIKEYIVQIETSKEQPIKFKRPKMNVLVPMAGRGSRLQEHYKYPKPLIPVMDRKPMIQMVYENLGLDANYIFIVQKEHHEKYHLDYILNLLCPNCTIIPVDGITEGAACTALLAREIINSDEELLIVNSDQYVEWNGSILNFFYAANAHDADVCIATFKATDDKWSFVKLDDHGNVVDVAEKIPISDIAIVGFYYWKHGCDFVRSAEKMIEANDRVKNEFYVTPTIKYLIEEGKKVRTYNVNKMFGTGDVESLEEFKRYLNDESREQ